MIHFSQTVRNRLVLRRQVQLRGDYQLPGPPVRLQLSPVMGVTQVISKIFRSIHGLRDKKKWFTELGIPFILNDPCNHGQIEILDHLTM